MIGSVFALLLSATSLAGEVAEAPQPTCSVSIGEDGAITVAVDGLLSENMGAFYAYEADPKTGACKVWETEPAEDNAYCDLSSQPEIWKTDRFTDAPKGAAPTPPDPRDVLLPGTDLTFGGKGCFTESKKRWLDDVPKEHGESLAYLAVYTLDPPMKLGFVSDYIARTRLTLDWAWTKTTSAPVWSASSFESLGPNSLGTNWYLEAARDGELWQEGSNSCVSARAWYWNTDFPLSLGLRVNAHHYLQICGGPRGQAAFRWLHTTWGADTQKLLFGEAYMGVL